VLLVTFLLGIRVHEKGWMHENGIACLATGIVFFIKDLRGSITKWTYQCH
jgi:hypothetical protein